MNYTLFPGWKRILIFLEASWKRLIRMLVVAAIKAARLSPTMSEPTDEIYHSFLVRCWLTTPETDDEPAIWRFELRDVPARSQKHRFGRLEQLTAFISARLKALNIHDHPERDDEEGHKGDTY